MALNYLTIALRYLWKQKAFSIINIIGLSISISICLVIFLYVHQEKSHDQFFDSKDNIHRLLRIGNMNGDKYLIGVTSAPFADAMMNDFPQEVKEVVRIYDTDGLVTHGDKSFYEEKIVLADSNFFNLFPFPLYRGDTSVALKDPNSIILTKETAKKYFGDEDPLNKIIRIDEQYDFVVTGVFNELPKSHLEFDFVANNRLLHNFSFFSGWWNNAFGTYVSFNPGTDPAHVEAQLPAFMDKYFGEDFASMNNRIDLTLQPIEEVYFEQEVRYDPALHGNKTNITIFIAIAFFILIVACINFINLATATSMKRAKEVGIRKVMGSDRKSLIVQFIMESMIISLISLFFGFLLIEIFLPQINALFNLELSTVGKLPELIPLMLLVLVVVGLLSGGYPAFVLSGYQPVRVLKSKITQSRAGFSLRKSLVVVQFIVSVLLIIMTLAVSQQRDFLQTKDLGFEKEDVILVGLNNSSIYESRRLFTERLENHPDILDVSISSGEPGGFHDASAVSIEGMENQPRMRTLFTDEAYVQVFDLDIVAGRNFETARPSDTLNSILLNEKAVKELGWTNDEAIGKILGIALFDSIPREVIGIVRDYHFSSLKSPIEPLFISYRQTGRMLAIKVRSQGYKDALASIKKNWLELSPMYPFSYNLLDKKMETLYANEHLQDKLFTTFSIVAIFIACLGIFGLASYIAVQRMKEVGIRKVLGASIFNISTLLTKEFIILVVIANVIAWPLGYLMAEKWLSQFVYRVDISIQFFVIAFVFVAVVAIGSVLYQAISAALVNPVKILKDE